MSVEQQSIASPEEVFDADDVAELKEFELDVQFAETGDVLNEFLRPTDDNCGRTCESACPQSCP